MIRIHRIWNWIKDRGAMLLLALGVIACVVVSAAYGKYMVDKNAQASINVLAEPKLVVTAASNGSGSYTVTNTTGSNMPAYVRFTVVANWIADDAQDGEVWFSQPVLGVDYSINALGYTKIGEHYYYNGTVPTGSAITLGTAKITERVGFTLEIEVLVEGIQSIPETAVKEAWGVTYNGSSWIEVPTTP